MMHLVAHDRRGRRSPPFDGVVGEPVSSRWVPTLGWHFLGLTTGRICGDRALLAESEALCARNLAVMECAHTGYDDVGVIRAKIWQNVCWLQAHPPGVPFYLDLRHGDLAMDMRLVSGELLAVVERPWAERKRVAGLSPFIARNRSGWKRGVLPGRTGLVEVSELLAEVHRLEGFATVSVAIPL